MKTKKVFGILVVVLVMAQLLLILISWLIAAAMPQSAIHSLLSNEGLRWFFGSLMQNLTTPVLPALLLLSMGWGCLDACGLLELRSPTTYRQRFALRVVALELIAIVAALLLLTAIPHAPLLSATGVLFPSSFSDSLLPVVCFVVIIVSLSYGFVSEKFTSFEMLLDAPVNGIRKASPLLLLYVLAAELYASLRFVF